MTIAGGLIAPWILESYEEAFGRLAVELPVVGADAYAQSAIVATAALVMFWLLWRGVAHLPRRAKIAARSLAAVPLLAPLVVFGVVNAVHLETLAQHPGLADIVAEASPVPPPDQLATPSSATATAPATVPSSQPAERTAAIASPAESPPADASSAAGAVEPPTAPTVGSPTGALSAASRSVDTVRDSRVADAARAAEPDTLPGAGPGAAPKSADPSRPLSETLAYLTGRPPVARLQRPRERPEVTVLFATDRGPTPEPASGGAAKFGVVPSGQVTLGRATLQPTHPSPDTSRLSPDTGLALPDTRRATVSAVALAEQDFATIAVRQLVIATRHPDQILVFVHGYDTGFDDAVRQGASFAAELGFDGAVVIYSWPSEDDPRGYRRDASRAHEAAPHLAATLRLLADNTSAKAVHIAAAGLGARTAVGAIRRFIDVSPGDAGAAAGLKLGELLLIAPDMDRAGLAEAAIGIAPAVSGITLYASANDRALAVTRRDAGLIPRAGDVVESGPLIAPAVVTIDVTPQPGDPATAGTDLIAGKSAAGEPGPLIVHARAVLSGGASRDPSVAGLRRVETTGGAYWVRP